MNSMTTHTSLRYFLLPSILAGAFLLTFFSFTAVAEAQTSDISYRVESGVTDYNYTELSTVTGPATVAPGETFTVSGVAGCWGTDYPPTSITVGTRLGSQNFPGTFTANCRNSEMGSVGTLSITAPLTEGPYSLPIHVRTLTTPPDPPLTFYLVDWENVGVYTYQVVSTFSTTPLTPTITAMPATNITTITATLMAEVNPNGSATTGWFRYSATDPGTCNDSFGTRIPTSSGVSLGGNTTSIAGGGGEGTLITPGFTYLSQNLTGLTPGTTYYFCAFASNIAGTTIGSKREFTTQAVTSINDPNAPTITPSLANNNQAGIPQSFTFLATDPDGDQIRYEIDWDNNGTVDSYLPGATTFVNSGVSQNGSYTWGAGSHTFRARTVDSNGGLSPWTSRNINITTPLTPTIIAMPATNITTITATLMAEVNPNGSATTGWFRYSATDPGTCNDSFGTRIPTSSGVSLGGNTTSIAGGGGVGTLGTPGFTYLSQNLTGLTPATTYYFCAFASNSAGTTIGSKREFTTNQPRLLICPSAVSVGDNLTRDLTAQYWTSLASVPNCSTPGSTNVTTSAGTSWSSSNSSSATVNNTTSKGRVTGGATPGTPTISATYNGVSATQILRVFATPSLTATPGTTGCEGVAIDLSWSAIAGATSYDLEINGTVMNLASNSYYHTGLDEGSSHNYRVRAVNAGGVGAWGTISATAPTACLVNTPPIVEAGVNIPLILPTIPTQIIAASASDPDGPFPSLNWTKVSGPVGGDISDATIINPTISNLNTVGTYRYRLTATDGIDSASDDMEITVSNVPIIAPVLAFSGSPTTITAGNSSNLTWTVGGTADSCWASWLNGGAGGWLTTPISDNQTVSPAVTTTYTLECWNSGASSGVRTVTVTVNAVAVPTTCSPNGSLYLWNGLNWDDFGSPIWSLPDIGSTIATPPGVFTGVTDMGSGVFWLSQNILQCGMAPVDLEASTPAANEVGALVVNNGIDGTYNNVTTRFRIINVGTGILPPSSAISYRAVLDGTTSPVQQFNGPPIFPASQSSILSRTFSGVMFGSHNVCARVNLDPTNYTESDLGNNETCNNFSLPVPRPPMSISSNNQFVRAGESVDIAWSAHTSYPLTCTVSGPGGISDSFDASSQNSIDGTAYTYSGTAGPLNNTGTFRLLCVEPSTGESHEISVTVEVIPHYQEI